MPAVTVDRWVAGCDAVVSDHATAGRLVATHLAQAGRTRPAVLHGSTHVPSARERARGFADAWGGDVAFEAEVPFGHDLPAGVRVPEEVAVVGVDDIAWAGLVEPALTTVRQPVEALGAEAATLLLERLERPELEARVRTLPVRLVVRASSPAHAAEEGERGAPRRDGSPGVSR